mmetsp:Transcript_4108/g.5752  ORF Transcript_4108/g.5752 Transcript_4108/m.5752 type:complete len:217 (+) Transcript_4108:648-1298(+)
MSDSQTYAVFYVRILQKEGVPAFWEEKWEYVTVLYEALVGDGTILPPVIFTNCEIIPKKLTLNHKAKICVVPNLCAPSGELTSRWLEEVSDYLKDRPLVLHDRGTEYKNKQVASDFQDRGIRAIQFPSSAGAFVNPCDNAFNAQLKYHYYKKQRRTYEEKLSSIVDSFYEISEDAVKHYFQKSGLLDEVITKGFINNMLHEGWQAGEKHEAVYDKC